MTSPSSCRSDNLLLSKCRERAYPPSRGVPDRGGSGNASARSGRSSLQADRHRPPTRTSTEPPARSRRDFQARHVANIHSFHSISHNLTHWIRNRYWTKRFITLGAGATQILLKDGIPAARITRFRSASTPTRCAGRRNFGTRSAGNSGSPATSSSSAMWGAWSRSRAGIPPPFVCCGGSLPARRETRHRRRRRTRRAAQAAGIGSWHIRQDHLHRIPGRHPVIVFGDGRLCPYVDRRGGETFPFALLQALAFGLPMVVTDVGEVGAMVVHGVTGFALKERDTEGISARSRNCSTTRAARIDGTGRPPPADEKIHRRDDDGRRGGVYRASEVSPEERHPRGPEARDGIPKRGDDMFAPIHVCPDMAENGCIFTPHSLHYWTENDAHLTRR